MIAAFDPTNYSPLVAELVSGDRLPELGPGSPNSPMAATLKSLTAASLGGARSIRNQGMAQCCLAGLWLHHDFLDQSHSISQEIDTPTGSYWHAIMHRREPDAGNSKYWWRRVGLHPVLNILRDECPSIGFSYSTPQEFVDRCERVRGTGTPEEVVAKRVQLLEWRILFNWCWEQAFGG